MSMSTTQHLQLETTLISPTNHFTPIFNYLLKDSQVWQALCIAPPVLIHCSTRVRIAPCDQDPHQHKRCRCFKPTLSSHAAIPLVAPQTECFFKDLKKMFYSRKADSSSSLLAYH